MTEPPLPFDPPLLASHPLADPRHTPPAQRGPPSRASKKRGKPVKLPLSFADKVRNQIEWIVAGILDAGDPSLNEEWLSNVVRACFEEALADRGWREVQKAKKAECELEEEPPPHAPGQPESAAPAVPKEKLTKAKHRNTLFNNRPLSPEEHAARNAAIEARWAAMTPEEREAAEAAARKKAGVLTPEEQKERRAADQEREKARIEDMPPAFRAQYLAGKAKAKQMMAEERARWAREQAAKKRSSE